LAARGEITLVVRESGVGFVGASAGVLPAEEIDELLRCLTKVQRLARRARASKGKNRSTVLSEDVAAPLARWSASNRPSPRAGDSTVSEALRREIGRRLRDDRRPIRVPDLLRAVGAPADEGTRAPLAG